MIYSREVEEMCPVAQGVHHGAAPIPEEISFFLRCSQKFRGI